MLRIELHSILCIQLIMENINLLVIEISRTLGLTKLVTSVERLLLLMQIWQSNMLQKD